MNTRASARQRARFPLHTVIAAASATGLALIGAVALGAAPATAAPRAAAVAPVPFCPPPGEMPGIGNVPAYTDSNVAVFAGGDYLATGSAAESEGLLLVQGDAVFDKANGGVFNVGSVGVGSGIVPPGGTTMLAVGGDLTVAPTTSVHVGANVDGGGAVAAGGAATGAFDLYGATLTVDLGRAAAMAPNEDFQSVVDGTSTTLGALPATGTTSVAFGRVTFTGTPGDAMQVFDVDGADLASTFEVFFEAIPADVPILINVTGDDVSFAPNYFSLNGERVDAFSSPNFGNAASRILWNVTDATSLLLGGSSQFMGSVLAPTATTEVTASTNGRMHVGGDLTYSGVGNEHHNYPWTGGGSLGCGGGFSASKLVTGSGAALVPGDTVFTLAYDSELDGREVTGTLSLRADGTVANGPQGLPDGTVVHLTEVDLPSVPGVEWGPATISPEVVTIASGEVVHVTVTNTANTNAPSAVGGFSVAKALGGEASALVPEGTEYTVQYRYLLDGEPVTGTVTVRADGVVVDGPQGLPIGTVVEFTEIDLPEIDGVAWGTPVFSPETVTIADGASTLVTVTNTATDAPVEPTPVDPTPETPGDGAQGGGSGLASTGVQAVLPALLAVLLVAAGITALVVRRRRTA
ncbi:choice-of-anchor A family protein [Agromyces cerinus]|uniref:Choice-of-anchor A domain-containing protein n=1 Tax=Agromyces cerinus subsp. cerinus TaxID=232089 RepID=A0A1N6I419_9MICO|nr:choice-of-anchor A family protein [Agromyces cerinus]SIO26709.1 choice-of-anchor A domain-containing protein [Agromyces cerinus subsp. cerinus]